ncbi:gram-negative bacteria binding protein [Biomphalaria glabrata]
MPTEMLRLLLIASLVSLVTCETKVDIKYKKSILELTLPATDKLIKSVTFIYNVKKVNYKETGVLTTEGWKYKTSAVKLNGADKIVASATGYDRKQRPILRTKSSTLYLKPYRGVALPGRRMRGVVFFRDDFNYIDTNNWRYEVSAYGGLNREFQVYTNDPRNVFTRSGNLYLKPTISTDDPRFNENTLRWGVMDVARTWGVCTNSANWGCYREGKYGILPPVMSGKLMSNPTLRYGVVEVRARISKGDWIWPAIWMLPRDNVYGGWPRSGEIDIMESRGNEVGIGISQVSSTLHWGPSPNENRWSRTNGERRTGSWYDSFHTWRLEWRPDSLITFVDDQIVLSVTPDFWQKGGFGGQNIWAGGERMAPFDKEFYLILNVAVGGTNGFFPDNYNWGKRKPWANNAPAPDVDFFNARNEWLPTWRGDETAMIVDYVEFRTL